jgi:hypothetical protein
MRDLCIKCAITFVFQYALVMLIIRESYGLSNVYQGDAYLNATRFICAYLLHYSIIPEVRCAIGLLKYIKNNRSKFNQADDMYPFIIGFLKLFAGYLTEIVNIIVIVTSHDI